MTSSFAQPGQRWPTGGDYARTVQHPPTAFADSSLRSTVAATNAMGMPLVASGQNAVVFLMKTGGDDLAVRCFTTPPSDGSLRYRALSEHLGHVPPTAITASRWLDDGIMVDGTHWPIVTMPWVDGQPLNLAVEDRLDDPSALRHMADEWVAMVDSLQEADVTHGDLQHGNVLVDGSGRFRLVDLDGCWVPTMRVGAPGESGHPNYQHPRRTTAQWARYGDSFPALNIEIGLRALAADPSLERFMNGENLLLTRADLSDLDREVWPALAASPDTEVVRLTNIIRGLAKGSPNATMLRYTELRAGRVADVSAPVAGAPIDLTPAAGGGDWWSAGSAVATPTALSPNGGGLITAVPAPPAPPATTPAPAAASSGSGGGLGAVLGKDAMVSGAIGGMLAAAIGSVVGGLIGNAIDDKVRPAVFVMSVAVIVGALLASWQTFLSGAKAAGMRRLGQGAVLGAVAGGIALPIANAIYGSASDQIGVERFDAATYKLFDFSPALSGGVWAVVALLLGLLIGARTGVTTAIAAGLGGAVAGFVGGLLFGGTVADFRGHLLLVDGADPATGLIVAAIGLVMGTAIGATSRTVSRSQLTIIEGRSKGMEILLPKKAATIGAAARNTLVLPNDGGVAADHAKIDLTMNPARLVRVAREGTLLLNGASVDDSAPLRDGDIITVGGSFVRFDTKGAS